MKMVSINRKIYHSELIEIVIPTGSNATKFNFPDSQDIRDSLFTGLETYTDSMVPISIISTNPVVTLAALQTMFVTLQMYNGNQFSQRVPLAAFLNMDLGNVAQLRERFFREYTGQKVNWPKSFIELTAPLAPAADVSVLFEVFYKWPMDIEKIMRGASFKKRS